MGTLANILERSAPGPLQKFQEGLSYLPGKSELSLPHRSLGAGRLLPTSQRTSETCADRIVHADSFPMLWPKTSSYFLRLRATDSGQPPLHEDTSVTIQVVDVNDNPPRFFQLNYSTTIQVRGPTSPCSRKGDMS